MASVSRFVTSVEAASNREKSAVDVPQAEVPSFTPKAQPAQDCAGIDQIPGARSGQPGDQPERVESDLRGWIGYFGYVESPWVLRIWSWIVVPALETVEGLPAPPGGVDPL